MPETPLDRNLDRLIDLLAANATVSLSGTKIASQLRVAPSTLWEWIERLRAMDIDVDRKSTRLNSSHIQKSRMPSSA